MTEDATPVRVERIDVCICSYRRPQIANTLAALARQTVPASSFGIIVADNTREAAARDHVLRVREALSLDLEYLPAPSDNISIARNACLDAAHAEWIAFIDDDELPAENWLAALIAEAHRGKWDAVLGPVIAIYDESAPEWLRRASPHSTTPVWRNGTIPTGYCGNVLFRRELARRNGLRFPLEFGNSGGEDDDFFYRFCDAGGCIGYAPQAVCYERVEPSRANLGWLLRRRFRAGASHALRLRQQAKTIFPVFSAAAKVAYCAAGAALSISDMANRNGYLMRGALHTGVVSRLLSMRSPATGADSSIPVQHEPRRESTAGIVATTSHR